MGGRSYRQYWLKFRALLNRICTYTCDQRLGTAGATSTKMMKEQTVAGLEYFSGFFVYVLRVLIAERKCKMYVNIQPTVLQTYNLYSLDSQI